jgi:hypothetical protein
MLQKLYRINLKNQPSQAQFLTLEILVWLLQVHKQVKIERLATHFPLPILKVYFVLRQKKDTKIKFKRQPYQELNDLGLRRGMKMFLTGIKVTQKKGFSSAAIAAYWKRAYRSKVELEPWYLPKRVHPCNPSEFWVAIANSQKMPIKF